MASGTSAPNSDLFVDRRAEISSLVALLPPEPGGVRFALVTGERGVGKTALIRRFAAGAGHARVVHASGEEAERHLCYGVVEQLLRSAAPPGRLQTMIADRSSPPDPAAVGADLLEHLHGMGSTGPVVAVVDDVHLADAQSQKALLFAFRRLEPSRVLVVLAMRDDGSTWLLDGLRKLVVGDAGTTISLHGLRDRGVHELVCGLGYRPPSREMVKRLREHTGGNPLHLRALIDEVGVERLFRSGELLWPAPRSFSEPVLERLAGCTPAAKRVLAAAAVLGLRCPLTLVRRLAAVDQPLVALQGAVDAGLLEYRGQQVAFSHPLLRSAVYHAVAIPERCELHARAATLVGDEAAALRHRAAASLDEEEDLASAFEAYAHREAKRGSWTGAAAMFEEAARLVPYSARGRRDVVEAVECHLVGGDLTAAKTLVGDIDLSTDSSRAHYVRGSLALAEGRLDEAAHHLIVAWDCSCVEVERELAGRIAVGLVRLNVQLLRCADAVRWARTAMSSLEGTRIAERPLPYLVFGLATTGRVTEALEAAQARKQPAERSGSEPASSLLAGAIAHLYAGAAGKARDCASGLAAGDACGAAGLPIAGLTMLGLAEYRLGAWDDSVQHGEQAISLVDGACVVEPWSSPQTAAVWPLSGRGRWEEAEALATRAGNVAHTPLALALARMAEAVIAHAKGDHHCVAASIAALRAVGPPGVLDEPAGLWPWQELLVESLISMARTDEADEELARLEERAANRQDRTTASRASRLRGTLEMARGSRTPAEAAFRRALDEVDEETAPFDRALALASYGAFLRRTGKRTAAAAHLEAARAGFARLGARPSLERCERELASIGLAPRRRRPDERLSLTPREQSVVRLVAQGKRNREVATELFVSVNTVEYHLKNIYIKLGVASRSQLILALGRSASGSTAAPGPPEAGRRGLGVKPARSGPGT